MDYLFTDRSMYSIIHFHLLGNYTDLTANRINLMHFY